MAEAHRTLVKSPPELWAEVSDPEALARHLGAFGEIRITRTQLEQTVAWEGDRARGTVELAPAGWGTKVTVKSEQVAEPEPEPAAEEPPSRRSFWARLLGRRPEREAPEPPANDEHLPAARESHEEVLEGMLGALGAAHHRPFSRG